ncbi:MAG: hypothetical protein K8W52_17395 [Deltaproteobacteria bacterium]|nr:hypothetical protein [Deltaproteobacteria bacterium]
MTIVLASTNVSMLALPLRFVSRTNSPSNVGVVRVATVEVFRQRSVLSRSIPRTTNTPSASSMGNPIITVSMSSSGSYPQAANPGRRESESSRPSCDQSETPSTV